MTTTSTISPSSEYSDYSLQDFGDYALLDSDKVDADGNIIYDSPDFISYNDQSLGKLFYGDNLYVKDSVDFSDDNLQDLTLI